jgi:ankyrin repeat protein
MLLLSQNCDIQVWNYSVSVFTVMQKQDNLGSTPLHWAALKGHAHAARLLVNAGVDFRIRDNGGHTAEQ